MQARVIPSILYESLFSRQRPVSYSRNKRAETAAIVKMSPARSARSPLFGTFTRRFVPAMSLSGDISMPLSSTGMAAPALHSLVASTEPAAVKSRAFASDASAVRTPCTLHSDFCNFNPFPSTPRLPPCCSDNTIPVSCLRPRSPQHFRHLFFSVAVIMLLLWSCCCTSSPASLLPLSPAAAQVVSYSGYHAPGPLSAMPQRGAFLLYGKGTRFYFPFFTSSSVAEADNKGSADATTITFKNLALTQESSTVVEAALSPSGGGSREHGAPDAGAGSLSRLESKNLLHSDKLLQSPPVSPASLEISLLPYEYTRTIFSSASVALFCCTAPAAPQAFVPSPECPYPGALKRALHVTIAPSPSPASSHSTHAAALASEDAGKAAVESGSLSAAGSPETHQQNGKSGPTSSNAQGRPDTATPSSAVSPASPGSSPSSSSSTSSAVVVAAPQYTQPVRLRGDGSAHEVSFEVKEGGIYFLVMSNCGDFRQLTFDGEVRVRNAYGYLPGHEYPKMPFYFSFMLVYLGLCFLWGFLLYRQRANLIAFHKCMLLVAALGFLECLALFVYFSDFNMRGSRNAALLVVSVLVSVIKNIFSYMLVLLGAIGWSITVPVLEKKTIVKMQIIVVLYIILDTARQVSEEFSHSQSLPLVLLLTCLFPISALNGLLFYWIISSINDNVEMLQQQKQHEKLLMYKRLYAVLLLAIFLAIIDLLCQIYVASLDASFLWKDQWWLSDAVPHFLFFLVLGAMMYIWRPNHQSKRLAYFTELGDADDLEKTAGATPRSKNATDMQVWGEELDFHDHFSEEELEAGIPNFQLHTVGSVSDEGEMSESEQVRSKEMHAAVRAARQKGRQPEREDEDEEEYEEEEEEELEEEGKGEAGERPPRSSSKSSGVPVTASLSGARGQQQRQQQQQAQRKSSGGAGRTAAPTSGERRKAGEGGGWEGGKGQAAPSAQGERGGRSSSSSSSSTITRNKSSKRADSDLAAVELTSNATSTTTTTSSRAGRSAADKNSADYS